MVDKEERERERRRHEADRQLAQARQADEIRQRAKQKSEPPAHQEHAEPHEVRFNPHQPSTIPPEVLDRIPEAKREEYFKAMGDEAVYRRGPAPEDIDYVRFHDKDRPPQHDKPDWYVPAHQAREIGVTDSARDMRQAAEVARVQGRPVSTEAEAYSHGHVGDAGRADLNEAVARPPQFGSPDTKTTLHVPKGATVETIESSAAPQTSDPPEPGRETQYPGGGKQTLVLSYDPKTCTTTPPPSRERPLGGEPLYQSYDLDAPGSPAPPSPAPSGPSSPAHQSDKRPTEAPSRSDQEQGHKQPQQDQAGLTHEKQRLRTEEERHRREEESRQRDHSR